jgi:hypothetical protein
VLRVLLVQRVTAVLAYQIHLQVQRFSTAVVAAAVLVQAQQDQAAQVAAALAVCLMLMVQQELRILAEVAVAQYLAPATTIAAAQVALAWFLFICLLANTLEQPQAHQQLQLMVVTR